MVPDPYELKALRAAFEEKEKSLRLIKEKTLQTVEKNIAIQTHLDDEVESRLASIEERLGITSKR
jgi:hypothetical protein